MPLLWSGEVAIRRSLLPGVQPSEFKGILFVDEHPSSGGEISGGEGAEVDAGGYGFAVSIASVPIGGAVSALIQPCGLEADF